MKKKALIYGLSAALLLASLTACRKPQTEQPDQSEPPIQAAASTPAPEEPTTTPGPEAAQDPTAQTPAAPEQLSGTAQAAPDENEAGQPPEETDPQEPAEEVQLFTDRSETVYATGTVNIRESWTASSTKLGSLSRGQSVTRTGIAIEGTDANGWSRVQLSDGTTAYISNQYLSTAKPASQSTGGSTGSQGTTTTQPSTGGDGGFKPGPGANNQQQTDWSEYQTTGGQELTQEKIEESWSHVGN